MCRKLILSLLLLLLLLPQALARPLVIILTRDDFKPTTRSTAFDGVSSSSADWDDFGYSNNRTQDQLDPGSWRSIFEPSSIPSHPDEALEEVNYYSSLRKLFSAVTSKDIELMKNAASEIEEAAIRGYPHAQSVLAFLYGSGQLRHKNEAKAFLYHHFASQGGNMQSKMALAYLYYRQNV